MFWSALELLNKYLPEIGLTGVYTVAILTFIGLCSDRLRHKTKEKDVLDFDDQIGRRLGMFESMVDDLHSCGGSLLTIVLLLKSKVPLQPTVVGEVLELLPKKHSILRMRVKEITVKGKEKPLKCFIEMDEPFAVDFHVKNKQAGHWESSFEKELLSPFQASDGPLWRVRMLKEEFETTEEWYSNTLLFTAHQLIADDTSLLKLCDDFLSLLNTRHNNNYLPSSDESLKLISVPLQASLSDLLKRHITISQLDKSMLALKLTFTWLLYKIVGKPRNQFTAVIPPTSLRDPSTVKKTSILPRNLPKEAISRLAMNCKKNKSTVHGAFIAAASIAMATMLQNGELRIPVTIPLSFKVNIRLECKPPVTVDDLGCFSLDCELKIPVLVLKEMQEDFWKFARECTKQVHQAVVQGRHHSSLKLLHNLDMDLARKLRKASKNKKTAGRLGPLFNISNLGRFTFGKEGETKVYESRGVYFASAGHNFGPVFGNNIIIVNDELSWSFVYYNNVVTHDVACQFADLVFRTLKLVS